VRRCCFLKQKTSLHEWNQKYWNLFVALPWTLQSTSTRTTTSCKSIFEGPSSPYQPESPEARMWAGGSMSTASLQEHIINHLHSNCHPSLLFPKKRQILHGQCLCLIIIRKKWMKKRI
jgi:hypothetical protein